MPHKGVAHITGLLAGHLARPPWSLQQDHCELSVTTLQYAPSLHFITFVSSVGIDQGQGPSKSLYHAYRKHVHISLLSNTRYAIDKMVVLVSINLSFHTAAVRIV